MDTVEEKAEEGDRMELLKIECKNNFLEYIRLLKVISGGYETIGDILFCVSLKTGVDELDIIGASRDAHVSSARDVFCYICRTHKYTYEEIGLHINRTHATVINSVRNVELCIGGLKCSNDAKMNYIRIYYRLCSLMFFTKKAKTDEFIND